MTAYCYHNIRAEVCLTCLAGPARYRAKDLKAARRLATKLYGRRSKLYLQGDTGSWSVLVRAEDGETNLAYIHLTA